MRILPFLYRELGEKKGYGYVQGRENAVRSGCERYMNFACETDGKSIRFTELENGLFMLLYVVAVPKGNSHESRGQVIASGYLFGADEADELMKHPEYIFELEYCRRAEDRMQEEIADWNQIRVKIRVKGNRQSRQGQTGVSGENLCRPYFSSVISNAGGEMNTQVFHVFSDYSEARAMSYLIRELDMLPVRVRKYISWNTNVRKITEARDFEWNFLEKDAYTSIETGGFSGGRAVERIILQDDNIVCYTDGEADRLWEKYLKDKDDGGDLISLRTGNRKEFVRSLQKKADENNRNSQAAGKKKHRRRYEAAAVKSSGNIKNVISVIVRIAALAALTVWTFGALQITKIQERIYTVSFSLDAICAAAIFGIAFLISSFYFDFRWRKKMKKMQRKTLEWR